MSHRDREARRGKNRPLLPGLRWGAGAVLLLVAFVVGFLYLTPTGQSRGAASAGVALPTNPPAPQSQTKDVSEVRPIPIGEIPGNFATGAAAPDFTVRTMNGGGFALAEHTGEPTLILFMASWCVSCIFEAQNLGEVYSRYRDRGLNVIALDVQDGDTDVEVQAFREAAGNPDYVWAFDDEYRVTEAYNVRTLDTTVLIDQEGRIVYYDQRPTPLEPLLQAVMAVLP